MRVANLLDHFVAATMQMLCCVLNRDSDQTGRHVRHKFFKLLVMSHKSPGDNQIYFDLHIRRMIYGRKVWEQMKIPSRRMNYLNKLRKKIQDLNIFTLPQKWIKNGNVIRCVTWVCEKLWVEILEMQSNFNLMIWYNALYVTVIHFMSAFLRLFKLNSRRCEYGNLLQILSTAK